MKTYDEEGQCGGSTSGQISKTHTYILLKGGLRGGAEGGKEKHLLGGAVCEMSRDKPLDLSGTKR